jgi:hypothetical protein
MKIEIKKIIEPKLEFAKGFSNSFIREALMTGCGPYEANFYKSPKIIKLGLISLPYRIDSILSWIESLQNLIVSKEKNIKKYPEYLGTLETLKCKFVINQNHIVELEAERFEQLMLSSIRDKFNFLLDMYTEKIQSLFTDNKPDCILVYFPEEIASLRVANSKLSFEERTYLERLSDEDNQEQIELFELTAEQKKLAEELLPQADELLFRNFHRALKAKCMKLPNSVPIQIIRDHTFNPDTSSQSTSTIAWNITLGLYYKAGNIPWRLNDISTDTCFAGISFHHLKRRTGSIVYASVAQAFSSSGEGFALKGSNIPQDQKRNKRPYLQSHEAEDIIKKVLYNYENRNGVLPTKLVIHKTSRFEPEEKEGFQSALKNIVPGYELVWFAPSPFRLLRRGQQPPERGTLCTLEDKEHFLFTTGYIEKWQEYPGPHIPSPLEIGADEDVDLFKSAKEILALTKMNWNSSDGIGRYPITLSFARRVGMIMTELEEDDVPNPSYRYYM